MEKEFVRRTLSICAISIGIAATAHAAEPFRIGVIEDLNGTYSGNGGQTPCSPRKRRSRGKRILSEAAGTFKLLEADLEAAIDHASRPPADLLDPHQSVKRETADDNGKRIMIIAATLIGLGR